MSIRVSRVDACAVVVDLATRAHSPVCVGIDGRGGAGKSSFAEELGQFLPGSVVVPLDDFVLLNRIADNDWEGVWDRDRLRHEVLTPYRQRRSFSYYPVNWETGKPGPLRTAHDVDYLVIEGITALHPDLRDCYDVTVWIDTPADIAVARGLERDQGAFDTAMWAVWRGNDDRYQRTMSQAPPIDVVVDNAEPL